MSVSAAGENKIERYIWGTRAYIDTDTTPQVIDALDHEFRNCANGGGGFASLVLGQILGFLVEPLELDCYGE